MDHNEAVCVHKEDVVYQCSLPGSETAEKVKIEETLATDLKTNLVTNIASVEKNATLLGLYANINLNDAIDISSAIGLNTSSFLVLTNLEQPEWSTPDENKPSRSVQ